MTEVNVPALEALMVDVAAGEPGESIALQIRDVCFTPGATLEACLGVLAATVKVANDAGVIPAAGDGYFYGLVRADNADPESNAPDDLARTAAMRALTAALNNEWDSVNAHILTQLQGSARYGFICFHQLLICWRSLVNTTEGALAVQLLGLGEDGTPE